MSGNDTDQPPTDSDPSSEDAFALLGNDIRVAIIRILGNAQTQEDSSRELTFSELRSLTETDIAPGQLNYHLQQLVGYFVKKTEDGYTLRPEGIHLYLLLRAGVFDRREERVSVAAGFDCYYCQESVEAEFSGRKAKVECPDCEYRYLTDNIAPSLVMFADEKAAFDQFSRYIHHKLLGYAHGICQICGNAVETELVSAEEKRAWRDERAKVHISLSCDHCNISYFLHVGVALLADPELIAFCYYHGVDVVSTPYWELEFAATDKHVTVRSTDPWEVALHVTYGDDTLELVADGSLNVVERNRLGASEDGGAPLLHGVQSGDRTMGNWETMGEIFLPAKADCLEYVRRHRWPDRVTCPQCDSTDTIKMGTTTKDAQRYRCHDCDSTFNDLTGTIFAEHHLSLPEMFHIIWEMDEKKPAQIAEQLDRSYKSVLDFMHEVQDARDEDSEFDL